MDLTASITMTLPLTRTTTTTYENPVYHQELPDPFVLKFCGEYWAYGSGLQENGRAFPIVRSRDLVHWEEVGFALEALPGDADCYWAPEVTYDNGRFYMYYSVGDEAWMEIRVAIAEHPAGPFVDSGHRLTTEPFAIDAHVYQDDDGMRYLFYAIDYLEHTHIGTGTARDRMLDLFTLAGEPRPVTRAAHDWQVYDPNRAEKGGVRWHTIEGSFVLKHKGLYYQMFSGGNWQNVSYGVSYAITDTLDRPGEWSQVADGEQVLPILRTIPGKVIGPGHNSVVRGPDNLQLYCMYHRWSEEGEIRQLAIDPLDWAGERMLVLGPSTGPQPVPLAPTFADFFDEEREEGLAEAWRCTGGSWRVHGGAARQEATTGTAEVRYDVGTPSFVAEVSLRAFEGLSGPETLSALGAALHGERGSTFRFVLVPEKEAAVVSWQTDQGWHEEEIALPAGFEPTAFHLLRVEVDGLHVRLRLDEAAARWEGWLAEEVNGVALRTEEMAAAFAGFAVTVGWQDDFMGRDASLAGLGWAVAGSAEDWRIGERQLSYLGEAEAILAKGSLLASYEMVVNARLDEAAMPGSAYGFCPAMGEDESGPLLTVQEDGAGYTLHWLDSSGERRFPLPEHFDGAEFQQFRFRKEGRHLSAQWEEHPIAEGEVSPEPTRVGLYARGVGVSWDLIRVTEIAERKEPYR
jgi:GH43 family beta-xylosidase